MKSSNLVRDLLCILTSKVAVAVLVLALGPSARGASSFVPTGRRWLTMDKPH